MNKLYYGDNLPIMREEIPSDSVDLIYVDPPYNSNKAYNIFFSDDEINNSASKKNSAAQIKAFDDTWVWSRSTELLYTELMETAPTELTKSINSFIDFTGRNNLMAYLVNMAIRIVELHRILKPTGSFYLHCDPTASHYLKIILDQTFGLENFRNEIIWSYRRWPSKQKNFQRMHDTIFRYSKTEEVTWNQLFEPLSESTLKQWGDKKQDAVFDQKTGQRKRSSTTAEKSLGTPMRDVWNLSIIAPTAKERLGYPTQKPQALLERIITASSNEGDLVLDAFCGCGTTIAAAEKLNRRWIGIDITHLAISLIESRLKNSFGNDAKYEVIGIPKDLSGATDLAKRDRYQFQWWAISLIDGARPHAGKKRGADHGVDGLIFFKDVDEKGKKVTQKIVIQVKSGKVGNRDIRELIGTLAQEKAVMAIFITLKNPTKPMRATANAAGFYERFGAKYPKIQIFTIDELFKGAKVHRPNTDKRSEVHEAKREQLEIT